MPQEPRSMVKPEYRIAPVKFPETAIRSVSAIGAPTRLPTPLKKNTRPIILVNTLASTYRHMGHMTEDNLDVPKYRAQTDGNRLT